MQLCEDAMLRVSQRVLLIIDRAVRERHLKDVSRPAEADLVTDSDAQVEAPDDLVGAEADCERHDASRLDRGVGGEV
jgi:hypothetical protein